MRSSAWSSRSRKHGAPTRRLWRKMHLGIDEETLEVRAVEVTGSNVGDAPMLPELLEQSPADQDVGSVTVDGAYDTRKCHDAIADRGACDFIPPRKNARLWKPDTAGAVARTRRSEQTGISAGPSGDISVDITAGAALRRKCIASNCWDKASWPETSTDRLPRSKSGSP